MNETVTTGALTEFEAHRGRMFGIAYRMLGSATEAEDIVQDAWLRWQTVTDEVESPAAYLATITTRLSLTALDSARVRRETYVGPWLPEPVSTQDDPLLGAERAEALSLAVLLLLERLTAAEQSVAADHTGLHRKAALEFDDKRNDPGIRKVHQLDALVRFRKHVTKFHLHSSQMR